MNMLLGLKIVITVLTSLDVFMRGHLKSKIGSILPYYFKLLIITHTPQRSNWVKCHRWHHVINLYQLDDMI